MADNQVAYLGNADDGLLPRWNSGAHDSTLTSPSSATSANRSTQTYSALYAAATQPPPPPPPQQQQAHDPTVSGPAVTARQHARLSHLIEPDHPSSSLSRSTSLGGSSRRAPPDDLERAFASDHSNQRQPVAAMSFYPSSVAYQTSSTPSDPYRDSSQHQSSDYYNPPRRALTHTEQTGSSRPPVSPRKPPTQTTQAASNSSQVEQSGSMSAYQYSSSQYQDPYRSSDSSSAYPKPASSPMTSPYAPAGPPPSSQSQQQQQYTSGPGYSANEQYQHLPVATPVRNNSVSTPNTPLNYGNPSQSQYYPGQDPQPMAVEPPPKRRSGGFKRVRDARDLRPYINPQPPGRRLDASGVFLSPLRALTTNITSTYNLCNPQFRYEVAHNPRRVLTKPSKPAHNDGYDNEDYDYILYVNDWLGTEEGHKYLILDVLGQGTFGQVVKCQNMKTHEIVAVKVVKNKPAYFNQSMMEVTILELLNNQCDPHDEHHILRLRDSFIHRNHLCLVFELLSSNLYELIKQNAFGGLSTQLVKVFTAQLLDALTVLKEARLIHCDLKPENILLKSLQSPQIKVIDFGSACHERQTVYTYIQSRFYRSPEVLLGIPYTSAIDMWSLGCIAVELFLGLPLFPGTSEYNQITRIVEMLGMPPTHMLELGKQTNQFFDSYTDVYGQKKYRLKTIEQYSREHGTQEQPGKKYFSANTLPEIIKAAPLPPQRSTKSGEIEKELNNRAAFIDFCHGLLNLNPIERWSPQQARLHPFITGEKFTRPYVPVGTSRSNTVNAVTSPSGVDPKRPYGGLVPAQPKGTRAYQDAATYNQHLAQHQAFTAQAQAASQAANNVYRNPYATTTQQQQPQQQQQPAPPQVQYSQSTTTSQNSSGHRLQQQASTNNLGMSAQVAHYPGGVPSTQQNLSVSTSTSNPNPPANSYYPNSRNRANTINQMDAVPPAIARIANMGMDHSGVGRNTLTPVINREEAMREWERRQSGKATHATYPQLEYLQQQAELASGWGSSSQQAPRYPPPSSMQHFQATQVPIGDGQERSNPVRDAVMSSVRTAARQDTSLTSPPQAYSSGSNARYQAAYQQPATAAYDGSYDRGDMSLYPSLQPHQYSGYSSSSSAAAAPSSRNPPQSTANPSFYSSAVVSAGQPTTNAAAQRNPFQAGPGSASGQLAQSQTSPNPKEGRRMSGMDIWSR